MTVFRKHPDPFVSSDGSVVVTQDHHFAGLSNHVGAGFGVGAISNHVPKTNKSVGAAAAAFCEGRLEGSPVGVDI